MPVVACCRLLPPTVGSGCLVLRVACRRFWMSAIASAVRRRFWLPVLRVACRRFWMPADGRCGSAPGNFGPPRPCPLAPLRASPRNHSGLTPTSSWPRSGTTPSLTPALPWNHSGLTPTSSRPRPGTTTEPVPERVVPRVPGRPLLINYRKLWPEICRKAPGIGYFCEKQP